MTDYLEIRPEVADALAAGQPVVALETTVLAHGLPYPCNVEAARRMAAAVHTAGALPGLIGVLDGKVRVGLEVEEIERFATAKDVAKVSRRDLAAVLAQGRWGATTVAATMACAALAGIRIFATGGIGGVHRGGQDSLDISADLAELARTPVAVVCAGAKSILDLSRTLEVLETNGVPVVGYGCDEFPAFFTSGSGLRLEARLDTPQAAAALLHAQWGLGLSSGIVIANPPPANAALDPDLVERWVGQALDEAARSSVRGGAVTPFVLARLAELSEGRTVDTNLALLEANAGVAGAIATAYAALTRH